MQKKKTGPSSKKNRVDPDAIGYTLREQNTFGLRAYVKLFPNKK